MEKMKAFLKSLYLGDRYCEKIEYHLKKLKIQVNCISRIKKGCDSWNYYSDEDIEHAILIFDEVESVNYNKDLILNDEIYEIEVVEKNNDIYSFVVYGCHIDDKGISTDIEIKIAAKNFFIINPDNFDVIKD